MRATKTAVPGHPGRFFFGQAPLNDANRVDWVDYAKGLCIILVVMFHTVNHYEEAVGATGWMRAILDFAKPFRMPDFFLISGLFLSRTINAKLSDYLDRKVVHFAYFYLLWLGITLLVTDNDVLRANPVGWLQLVGWNIVQPTGVLWFVHMLAVFYILTRIARKAPKALVLAGAGALQIAHQAGWIDTPSYILNRGMDYFVFFFLGYAAHELVFAMADKVRQRVWQTLGVLAVWVGGEFILTRGELDHMPGAPLLMGLAGALAVAQASVLLSRSNAAGFLQYCGRNSIVIYLTFFFPMMVMIRVLAPRHIPDVGWTCMAITIVSVAAPLAFHYALRKTPLNFLYQRPDWAKLGARKVKSAPAAAAAVAVA